MSFECPLVTHVMKAATGPTDEEMEQNEAIANLTHQYTCED